MFIIECAIEGDKDGFECMRQPLRLLFLLLDSIGLERPSLKQHILTFAVPGVGVRFASLFFILIKKHGSRGANQTHN